MKAIDHKIRNSYLVTGAIILAVAAVYYFSNPKPSGYYDYTFRVAERLVEGHVSLDEQPPSWLNEFVPFDGGWYSVFPFGAVVTMVPVAVLKVTGLTSDMPAALLCSLLAAACCLFMLLTARRYDISVQRTILLTLAILFGTFTWTNLTFGGAWQLALGFAMLGELGAIWFTVFDRRPFIAGLFFAMAFGNRTEILLTAPIFLYLLNRAPASQQTEKRNVGKKRTKKRTEASVGNANDSNRSLIGFSAASYKSIAYFCAVPFVLGVATLIYNYVRFHSFTDFGYARIPGVLKEPWYTHGIFSVDYIPRQAWEMLLRLWEVRPLFPYLRPNPFSSSILLSSPFLLFVLRRDSRDRVLKRAAWVAIAILTFLLWIHGNSGGWQFGYRYAMILLPWVFIILLENSPKKISPLEWGVYIFSFCANAYATWLFHWTNYMNQ